MGSRVDEGLRPPPPARALGESKRSSERTVLQTRAIRILGVAKEILQARAGTVELRAVARRMTYGGSVSKLCREDLLVSFDGEERFSCSTILTANAEEEEF